MPTVSRPDLFNYQTPFREALAKLASSQSLTVDQGNLVPRGFFDQLNKPGETLSNGRLIELKIMEFLVQGRKWLERTDLKLIESLVQKAGLFSGKEESVKEHEELHLLVSLLSKEVLHKDVVAPKEYTDVCEAFQKKYGQILAPFSKECEQVSKTFAEVFQTDGQSADGSSKPLNPSKIKQLSSGAVNANADKGMNLITKLVLGAIALVVSAAIASYTYEHFNSLSVWQVKNDSNGQKPTSPDLVNNDPLPTKNTEQNPLQESTKIDSLVDSGNTLPLKQDKLLLDADLKRLNLKLPNEDNSIIPEEKRPHVDVKPSEVQQDTSEKVSKEPEATGASPTDQQPKPESKNEETAVNPKEKLPPVDAKLVEAQQDSSDKSSKGSDSTEVPRAAPQPQPTPTPKTDAQTTSSVPVNPKTKSADSTKRPHKNVKEAKSDEPVREAKQDRESLSSYYSAISDVVSGLLKFGLFVGVAGVVYGAKKLNDKYALRKISVFQQPKQKEEGNPLNVLTDGAGLYPVGDGPDGESSPGNENDPEILKTPTRQATGDNALTPIPAYYTPSRLQEGMSPFANRVLTKMMTPLRKKMTPIKERQESLAKSNEKRASVGVDSPSKPLGALTAVTSNGTIIPAPKKLDFDLTDDEMTSTQRSTNGSVRDEPVAASEYNFNYGDVEQNDDILIRLQNITGKLEDDFFKNFKKQTRVELRAAQKSTGNGQDTSEAQETLKLISQHKSGSKNREVESFVNGLTPVVDEYIAANLYNYAATSKKMGDEEYDDFVEFTMLARSPEKRNKSNAMNGKYMKFKSLYDGFDSTFDSARMDNLS